MKFIIGYKIFYLLLFAGNIVRSILAGEKYGIDDFIFSYIALSVAFIAIHSFLLKKILKSNLGPVLLNLERVLSIGRMVMTLLVSARIGISIAMFISPVFYILWIPAVDYFDHPNRTSFFTTFHIVCLLLFVLEVYYFWLLNRNKNELKKNIQT